MIYDDNSFTVGQTPLVKLNRLLNRPCATVLAKIEGRDPTYSVKSRIGAAMVWDAEARGVLGPGIEIVGPTSGNTGMALALVGAARGYRVTLTMPDTVSFDCRTVMRALGANLVLTDGIAGMKGAVAKAEEIVAASPRTCVLLQEFQNRANPEIHFLMTSPEIWCDTEGVVDVVVCGIGTGGTITGVSRFLKQRKPILSVGVEPSASPVITQTLNRQPVKPGPHSIKCIGVGFIPEVLDVSMIDRIETVSDEEAVETAQRLAQEEGIVCGTSSGTAAAVALRFARNPDWKNRTIVVVLPDAGERCLRTTVLC